MARSQDNMRMIGRQVSCGSLDAPSPKALAGLQIKRGIWHGKR